MSRFTKGTYRAKFDERTDTSRRQELGELLRRARRQAGLTQAGVARTLGYKKQSSISEIENAKRMLDPTELENSAHLYGKTMSDFATWRNSLPSTEELRDRALGKQQEKGTA